jgi:hypothetical protein
MHAVPELIDHPECRRRLATAAAPLNVVASLPPITMDWVRRTGARPRVILLSEAATKSIGNAILGQ